MDENVFEDVTEGTVPELTEGYGVDWYPVRWAPYKPDWVRQTGKPGRWQRLNEYGGWQNCEAPDRVYKRIPEELDPNLDPPEVGEDWFAKARVRRLGAT